MDGRTKESSMFNNYMRIVINGDKSYLTYNRGDISEIVPILKSERTWQRTGLSESYTDLRYKIRSARSIRKCVYSSWGVDRILDLAKEKKQSVVSDCFLAKEPLTDAKHIGVEIEFCSNIDRKVIAKAMVDVGVNSYIQLKSDRSVQGDRGDDGCNGECREDCNCAECGKTHYCRDERECSRRTRDYGQDGCWEIRENCDECEEYYEVEGCICGGETGCRGEHVVCLGHCTGHTCLGYEDHNDFECTCECTCTRDRGHEIAIVAPASKMSEVLNKVCTVLDEHGAYVNSTCGLHVHLDARKSNQKLMFSNLVNSQKLLYSMCPKSRYDNSYCAPNESGTDMYEYGGRYWGINPGSYQKHKTIEVRLHSGSVNADKIIHWIYILKKIAYHTEFLEEIDSLKELTTKIKFSQKSISYIKVRVSKFKSEHGSYSIDTDLSRGDRLELQVA
jgi:hypothetical protein